ncbi:hypothetical protein DAEQUDRAFT_752201 [Daedalea quercina L-15889]|uniref:Vacuolar sorting protein 39/Transforming growth factor beta receptor-associated domain-containing protein n=1 Tax=Daedalea quercina L-15889 TaxID=1314783 RepID=A0A165MX27_9APHY|nr:hypothetical protein DAEQUDRAFT_752201 [Daedalea quercina L-15889]
MSRQPSFPRANVLVLGGNSVQVLLPSTLVSQADALLQAHRIEDAADLADQQRRKLQALITVDEHEAEELRYVYQRLGFQCLTETLFDDAGKHLFAGEVDPRVLISYFPDLCGNLFLEEDAVDVFAGVAEYLPHEESIDDIIAANLVLNYSPHLSPNTREAPPAVELKEMLRMTARDMLEVYLRKWRTKLKMEDSKRAQSSQPIMVAIDTVLAKLYVAHSKPADLQKLLSEPNVIVLPELEPVLVAAQRFGALCKLYGQYGQESKLLSTWAKLVDGEWKDDEVKDPLGSIFALLGERRDRTLIQQWGIWLTKRDSDRALKLLTSLSSGKRTAEDDRGLLTQLQEADPSSGRRYLEHLVLKKRSQDPELHMQLAMSCLDELFSCIEDESTSKLWRAKLASYTSSRSETSFLSYFASTTPDSAATRTRLKTILFLQGSTLYDPQPIRQRLLEHEKILQFEIAIINGKLGEHRSALTSLVHGLRDPTSAEIYCTLGGEIVPPKTTQSLGERFELQAWAALTVPTAAPGRPALPKAQSMSRVSTVDGELKKSLVRLLVEVYMGGGEATAERTARFLNAQAMNLDVLDVISLIPPDWPLSILSTFVARSLRRTLHAHHEGQIVKAVSASENLAVAERTWVFIREQGAIIEEAVDDGEEGDERVDEKGVPASFDEKVALHAGELAQEAPSEVVDIPHPEPGAKEAASLRDPPSDVEVGT